MAAERFSKGFLLAIALPVAVMNFGSGGSGDFERPVRRTRVDHDDLLGPCDRRQRPAKPRFLVLRDDENRDRNRHCGPLSWRPWIVKIFDSAHPASTGRIRR